MSYHKAHYSPVSRDDSGIIDCILRGDDCLVTTKEAAPQFLTRSSASTPEARELADLTGKLNGILRAAHNARSMQDVKLGLLITKLGLLAVWKREFDGEDLSKVDMSTMVPVSDMSESELVKAFGLKI